MYHMTTGVFEELGSMPERRSRFKAQLVGNTAYIVGGIFRNTQENWSVKECLKYDANDQKFQKFGELTEARENPSILVTDQYLYVFSGFSDSTHRKNLLYSVERRLIN